jgi:hypothetical protein
MGIMIICGIIFIIGLIIGISYYVQERNTGDNGLLFAMCFLIVLLFSIPLVIAGSIAMAVQIPKEKDYQQAVYERQVIEYRLENKDDNIVGNELLYKDIVEFNNNLRQHKRYADSFWIGIFHNDKIATIEYIEIDGIENYKD